MGFLSAQEVRLDDGTPGVIQTATCDDAEGVLQATKDIISEGIYSLTTMDEFCLSLAEEQILLKDYQVGPDKLFLVAKIRDRVVGTLNFQCSHKKRLSHHGEFGLAVRADQRSKGLGGALLAALLAWADQQPAIEKVCLRVFANNQPAIKLYRRFGFLEEGRQVRHVKFGEERYVDLVHMYKWLGAKQ